MGNIELYIGALTGPGGALIVFTAMFYGFYLVLTKHFIPIAKQYVESLESRWREQMNEHIEDRDAYKTSIHSAVINPKKGN